MSWKSFMLHWYACVQGGLSTLDFRGILNFQGDHQTRSDKTYLTRFDRAPIIYNFVSLNDCMFLLIWRFLNSLLLEMASIRILSTTGSVTTLVTRHSTATTQHPRTWFGAIAVEVRKSTRTRTIHLLPSTVLTCRTSTHVGYRLPPHAGKAARVHGHVTISVHRSMSNRITARSPGFGALQKRRRNFIPTARVRNRRDACIGLWSIIPITTIPTIGTLVDIHRVAWTLSAQLFDIALLPARRARRRWTWAVALRVSTAPNGTCRLSTAWATRSRVCQRHSVTCRRTISIPTTRRFLKSWGSEMCCTARGLTDNRVVLFFE